MPINKKYIKAVVFTLFIVICLFFYFKTDITVVSPLIKIKTHGHDITGKLSKLNDYNYVLKDTGISIGVYSGDGFFSAFTFEKAEELRKRYGNFFKCSSDGKDIAIQNVSSIVLTAQNSYTKKMIRKTFSRVKSGEALHVKFTASVIHVLKNKYMGMNVEDTADTRLFYVKDLTIISTYNP